jgi:hypothetical protein
MGLGLTTDDEPLELLESTGPWPFVSRQVYRRPDGSHRTWRSRDHRKKLPARTPSGRAAIGTLLIRSAWNPTRLNWWIGVVFALGSMLFMLGSALILYPSLAQQWSFDAETINIVFFAGSIPFTIAAYLQLYQAANAGEFSTHGVTSHPRITWFGWEPRNIGWLSCALQFVGALMFNLNTFDALLPDLDWLQQDLAIWVPDVAGSILFLASGHLAFAETGHVHFSWRPASLSWWITLINLLGCVAFMISAVYAFVPSATQASDAVTISVAFTFIGAAGFLTGALLLLPEAVFPADR